jgi:hypothetical protein
MISEMHIQTSMIHCGGFMKSSKIIAAPSEFKLTYYIYDMRIYDALSILRKLVKQRKNWLIRLMSDYEFCRQILKSAVMKGKKLGINF